MNLCVEKEIKLGANTTVIKEVLITARNPISEDFSVVKIERLDVYFHPLSKGDPLNAIQMLPASTDTEESASPSLRGSSPGRSVVVVDGVPIRNPVRFTQLNGTGNFSIFNTELMESQDVYAGNPPLIYGNSSAGLVDLKLLRQALRDGFTLTTALGNIGGLWNKTLRNDNGLVTIYANHGQSDLFTALNGNSVSSINSFRNSDIGIRIYSQLSDNVSFSFYNYSATEGYDVNYGIFAFNGNVVGDQLRNFTVANLEWGNLNNQWSINAGSNISTSDFSYGVLRSDVERKDAYASLNYKRINEQFVFQTGMNYAWNRDVFGEVFPIRYYDFREDSDSFFLIFHSLNMTFRPMVMASFTLGRSHCQRPFAPICPTIAGSIFKAANSR